MLQPMILLCFLAAAAATTTPKLGGTFITLTLPCKDWTANRWDIELDSMVAIGIREVVVQESAYDNVAFYRSISGYTYWGNNPIEHILSAADKRGMAVHLGLLNAQSMWFTNPQLARLRAANLAVAKELHAQFGQHKSFVGFYIPQEIDNLNWQTPTAQRALISDFLAPLTKGLRAIAPARRVSISAFFNPAYADPATYSCLWRKIVAAAPGLYLLLQDGVGVRGLAAATVQAYFSKLGEAFAAGKLIGVVETFAANGAPAKWDRVQAQMTTLAAWPLMNYHYADFGAGASDSLYTQYKTIYG